MLDKISAFLNPPAITGTGSVAQGAGFVKTHSEFLQYGTGDIKVRVDLSADRQLELNGKLAENKQRRADLIDQATRLYDETVSAAADARNRAVDDAAYTFALEIFNLFVAFGRPKATPKLDEDISIPRPKPAEKPSEILARARRREMKSPVFDTTVGMIVDSPPPTTQVSNMVPMKPLTDETEK